MHYAAFLDQHETVVTAEIDFLPRRDLHDENPARGKAALA
jgi:hypothetical protein